MNKPPRDIEKSWTVSMFEGWWYWYDDQGNPYGPYDQEEFAWLGLEDYDANYYD